MTTLTGQALYDSERNNPAHEEAALAQDALRRSLREQQADKPADHFDPTTRKAARSDFASRGAAVALGKSLKGASLKRISQALAIATLSASRANGVNNSESLGKLTAQIEALLAPYNVGG